MIREILAAVDILGLGILFGGGVYESVVVNPNYRANIPESLSHLRQFMKVRTPANLFRIASPVTMLSLLASGIASWGLSASRWWFVAAFFALVIADSITYTFHYPRNKVMFIDPLSPDTAMLQRVANEWGRGNLVRIVLMTIALITVLCGVMAFPQTANI